LLIKKEKIYIFVFSNKNMENDAMKKDKKFISKIKMIVGAVAIGTLLSASSFWIIKNRGEIKEVPQCMQRSLPNDIITFDKIVEPTPRIKQLSISIIKKSKNFEEMIYNSLKVIEFIKIASDYEPRLPQTPKQLEISRKGDCNELSYYLYSLLLEIKKNSDKFGEFHVDNVDVFTNKDNKDVGHYCLSITVPSSYLSRYKNDIYSENDGKSTLLIDPTYGVNGIGVKHKLIRILSIREVIAEYYRDGAASCFNACNKEAFKNGMELLKIALTIAPNSPTVLMSLSRMYYLLGKTYDSTKVAEKVATIFPNWERPYVALLRNYYHYHKNYKKAKECWEKLRELDPNDLIVKSYKDAF
jgi:tetratricopeptide (TPR) repeat protein